MGKIGSPGKMGGLGRHLAVSRPVVHCPQWSSDPSEKLGLTPTMQYALLHP